MKIKWNQHPWMQLRLTMVSHERLSSTVGFYWCQYLNCTPDSRRLDLRPTGTHVVLQKLTDAWTTLSEGTTRTCRPSLGISEILLRCVWQRFSPSSSLLPDLPFSSPLWEIRLSESCILTPSRCTSSVRETVLAVRTRPFWQPQTSQQTWWQRSPARLDLPPRLNSQLFRLLLLRHSKDIHLTATAPINGC